MIPKNKFDLLKEFFVMIGSNTEMKNEINAMQLTATDALANFIEPYQATQCKVKIIPMQPTITIFFMLNFFSVENKLGINSITTETISTRYQTNGNSLMEMSLPKMAVKPQRNVVMCICMYAVRLVFMLRRYAAQKSLTSFVYYI